MASCADAYKPFDEGDGEIPTAKGSPATVANARFSGALTLKENSLKGNGWTQEQVEMLVTVSPFVLAIENSKLTLGATMREEQLLCPDSSNPNIIELSKETVLEEGTESETTYTEYIKIILDDAANPTTAEVEYHFKLYVPAYAGTGYSDTVIAIYEGTLTKDASPSS